MTRYALTLGLVVLFQLPVSAQEPAFPSAWPTLDGPSYLASPYGYRYHIYSESDLCELHSGVDIRTPHDREVLSVLTGKVIRHAENVPGSGDWKIYVFHWDSTTPYIGDAYTFASS